MKKLLEFFQDLFKWMSSGRRLGFLSTIPFATYGTYKLCTKLIETEHAYLAVNIWNSFFIFASVLGGFVTVDAVTKLISSFKGKNDPKKDIEPS